ncbi:MAG: hypothetical protein KGI94_13125 [Paracoccaceae bacterium]|nr:hypothetical protein [Paracoccaceae bacterium]MDE3120761.1 hypothetical protein [Paracoccaceae bacterium]MDE3238162.1 hypothetical protein [Paracoccaceae bacterium]
MTARPILCAACLAVAIAPAIAAAYTISDPLAAAPKALRVTVSLPEGIGILPGSAALHVSVTNPKTAEMRASTDGLTEIGATNGAHALALAKPAEADFANLEKTVADWRRANAAPAAQIDVTFTPCRTTEKAAAGGTISVALQPDERAPRLVLVPPGTLLSDYLGDAAARIVACPK